MRQVFAVGLGCVVQCDRNRGTARSSGWRDGLHDDEDEDWRYLCDGNRTVSWKGGELVIRARTSPGGYNASGGRQRQRSPGRPRQRRLSPDCYRPNGAYYGYENECLERRRGGNYSSSSGYRTKRSPRPDRSPKGGEFRQDSVDYRPPEPEDGTRSDYDDHRHRRISSEEDRRRSSRAEEYVEPEPVHNQVDSSTEDGEASPIAERPSVDRPTVETPSVERPSVERRFREETSEEAPILAIMDEKKLRGDEKPFAGSWHSRERADMSLTFPIPCVDFRVDTPIQDGDEQLQMPENTVHREPEAVREPQGASSKAAMLDADLPPGFGGICESSRTISPRRQEINIGGIDREAGMRCHYCGDLGHFRARCPKKNTCFGCGETGHKMHSCPKELQAREGRKADEPNLAEAWKHRCYKCRQLGHLSYKCSEHPRSRGDRVQDYPEVDFYKTRLTDTEKDNYLKENKCFTCGLSGHPYYNCPQGEKRFRHVFDEREQKARFKLLREPCWIYEGDEFGPVSLSDLAIDVEEGLADETLKVKDVYGRLDPVPLSTMLRVSRSKALLALLSCVPEAASFLEEPMDAESCKAHCLVALQTKLHFELLETTARWLFTCSLNEELQHYLDARKAWGGSAIHHMGEYRAKPSFSDCEDNSGGISSNGDELEIQIFDASADVAGFSADAFKGILAECEEYVGKSRVENPVVEAIGSCLHSAVIGVARTSILDVTIGKYLDTWLDSRKRVVEVITDMVSEDESKESKLEATAMAENGFKFLDSLTDDYLRDRKTAETTIEDVHRKRKKEEGSARKYKRHKSMPSSRNEKVAAPAPAPKVAAPAPAPGASTSLIRLRNGKLLISGPATRVDAPATCGLTEGHVNSGATAKDSQSEKPEMTLLEATTTGNEDSTAEAPATSQDERNVAEDGTSESPATVAQALSAKAAAGMGDIQQAVKGNVEAVPSSVRGAESTRFQAGDAQAVHPLNARAAANSRSLTAEASTGSAEALQPLNIRAPAGTTNSRSLAVEASTGKAEAVQPSNVQAAAGTADSRPVEASTGNAGVVRPSSARESRIQLGSAEAMQPGKAAVALRPVSIKPAAAKLRPRLQVMNAKSAAGTAAVPKSPVTRSQLGNAEKGEGKKVLDMPSTKRKDSVEGNKPKDAVKLAIPSAKKPKLGIATAATAARPGTRTDSGTPAAAAVRPATPAVTGTEPGTSAAAAAARPGTLAATHSETAFAAAAGPGTSTPAAPATGFGSAAAGTGTGTAAGGGNGPPELVLHIFRKSKKAVTVAEKTMPGKRTVKLSDLVRVKR